MDLSIIKDYEETIGKYGAFLRPSNPIPADHRSQMSDEIDIMINYKQLYKGNESMFIYIDAIEPTTTRINQGTIWITGFPRKNYNDPHHSLLGVKAERFIIKLSQVRSIEIIKNSNTIRATLQDTLVFLQSPGLIDDALRIIEENQAIVNDILGFMRDFVSRKSSLVPYNVPWEDTTYIWNRSFSSLASFTQTFHLFKKDAYRALDVSISEDNGEKRIQFLKTPFNGGETVALATEFSKFCSKPCTRHPNHPRSHLFLDEDDKELIKELQGSVTRP